MTLHSIGLLGSMSNPNSLPIHTVFTISGVTGLSLGSSTVEDCTIGGVLRSIKPDGDSGRGVEWGSG